jgi:hypothetical protein
MGTHANTVATSSLRRTVELWRRAVVLTAAMLVAATGWASPAFAAGDDREVTAAQSFREDFGFPAKESYVRDLLGNPRAREALETYGAPLTSTEQLEVEKRGAVVEAADRLRTYAEREASDHFAGLYMDQQAGGLLRVGFTAAVDDHAAVVRSRFPYPERLRFFRAKRTLDELNALQARINDQMPDLRDAGIEVRTVSVEIPDNVVEVGVVDAPERAERRLEQRFGDGVRVVATPLVAPTPRTNSYPPLKAGLTIDSLQGLTSYRCTSSFITEDGGDYFMLTAGHCGPVGSSWTHAVYYAGRMTRNAYFNGSSADAATIQISPLDRSNLIFISDSNLRAVRSSNLSDTVGALICQSGNSSGYVCGSIESTDMTVSYSDATFYNQRRATFPSIPGDSGGPLFAGGEAHGVMSGNVTYSDGDQDAIYSHITHVNSQLGTRVLVCCR